MGHHGATHLTEQDTKAPDDGAFGLWLVCMILGVVGLGVGLLLAFFMGEDHGWQRFAYSYLISFAFWLAPALGCLFFVIATHLFRAGWCVMVRRVAENGAAAIPVFVLLSVPILFFVWAGDGTLYPWANDKWAVLGAEKAAAYKAAYPKKQDKAADPAKPDEAAATEQTPAGAQAPDAEPTYFVANTDDHAATGVSPDPAHADTQHSNLTAGYQAAPSEGMLMYFLFHKDGSLRGKGQWLQPWFFTLRWIVILAIWCGIALYYRNASVKQDKTGDPALTNQREARAPLSVIAFAFTVTIGIFDLIMSLDPTWYSTIFGVYYFANAFTAGLCVIILAHMLLQAKGRVPTVNTEHYHDLGKLLFAFVFFWGYVAYSQYILIWYPSMPEIAYWFQLRGVTTVPEAPQYGSGWTILALILLFGHLLIPFAFLLSKHVKRNRLCLMAACVWMLAMVAVDLFWLVRPVLSSGIGAPVPKNAEVGFHFGELIMLVSLWIGVGGIAVAAGIRASRGASLIAKGDPRLHESLKLDTSSYAPMYGH